jgi:hypothetical protein
MKRYINFCLTIITLSLLSLPSLAIKLHTATYSLSAGMEIGKEQRILKKQGDKYHYKSKTETVGIAKIFKNYQVQAESIFSLSGDTLKAHSYKYLEKSGKKIKKNIDINLEKNTIDPLSIFLSIANMLKKNPKQEDFHFEVNNGKYIKHHHYKQAPSKDPELIKIIDYEKPDKLEAFFAKDKEYLPVLIITPDIKYKLKNLEF